MDNADDPELLKAFYPCTPRGHILLTSRAHLFDELGIVSLLALEQMDQQEALDFLFKRTERSLSDPNEKNAAEQLASELGYLPLALEQAAAYITAKGARFQDYLTSYQQQRLSLLNKADPKTGNYPASRISMKPFSIVLFGSDSCCVSPIFLRFRMSRSHLFQLWTTARSCHLCLHFIDGLSLLTDSHY